MQRVLSIEIGTVTTKVCEMEENKKNPRIYQTIRFDTPEHAVEDGYIVDKETLAQELLTKIKEAGCRTKNVIFSIASGKILSREVTIPLVKENRIQAVVEAQASEYFPKDITDHIVTYTVLKKNTEERKMQLIAYAAPANLVRNYYSFAKMLGLNIVAVDYAGNASYQWLRKKINTDTGFVLQINEENSIVTILQNGVLTLQRNLNYGTNLLAQAVTVQNNYEMQAAASEAKTAVAGMSGATGQTYRHHAQSWSDEDEEANEALRMQQMHEVMMESLELFISSLTRIIEYQTTRSNQQNQPIAINEITIAGLGAQIHGMDALIGNELGIPVHTNQKVTEIAIPRDANVDQSQLEEFVTCFGAVLAPAQFIPKDYAQTKEKKEFWKVYLGLFAATVAAGLLLVTSAYSSYQEVLDQKTALEQQIAGLQYINQIVEEHQAIQNEYQSLHDAQQSTVTCNETFCELLAELEQMLPSGCLVHTLTSSDHQLTMSMSAASKEIAAKVILQLRQISYLTDISISGMTESNDEATGLTDVSFSVSCTYEDPVMKEGEHEIN